MGEKATTQGRGPRRVPAYRDLPVATPISARQAWDVFGEGDELGRVNLLDQVSVLAGASEIVDGTVFNLCIPLNQPDPPWEHSRRPYSHTVYEIDRNSLDDYLDGFYLQCSTQWDGLRHVRARELGFWGGRQADEGVALGIERWAEHGLVGRGVLVDVARHVEQTSGTPLDPHLGTAIPVGMLQATLAAQHAELRRGDVLMVRTGYVEALMSSTGAARSRFAETRDCPGLHAGEEMAEYLWDHGVAAVVADNPAVEVVPGSKEAGSLHRRLIPLLGFALGELFDLGQLAGACARDGRYACLFVAAPLNLPGGVGSPGNAVAIR